MFELIETILYGQLTEERKWGLLLLALSLALAVPVGWTVSHMWIGWTRYVAASGAFFVTLIVAGQVWGSVLSRVRQRVIAE